MVPTTEKIQTAINQARVAVEAIHKVSQRSYWKQGDPASESSDTQEQIFHAVGAVSSAWESAESALATLYVVLCDADGASSIGAITRTFGSIMSSGTRRDRSEERLAARHGRDSWHAARKSCQNNREGSTRGE